MSRLGESKLGIVLKETATPQYIPGSDEVFVYVKNDTPNICHYVNNSGIDIPLFSSPQVISFNSNGDRSSDGNVLFNTFSTSLAASQYVLPRNGFLKNFYVIFSNDAGGGGQFYTINIFVNNIVEIASPIIDAPTTTYTNTSTIVPIEAGDLLMVRFTRTGSSAPVSIQASISFF
jgi:hypothetical protein